VFLQSVLQLCELSTGTLCKTFPLPVGTVIGYAGKKKHKEMFYKFTSFLTPGIIYHCDFEKKDLEPEVSSDVQINIYVLCGPAAGLLLSLVILIVRY
jgi:prolyl oligopeptidase